MTLLFTTWKFDKNTFLAFNCDNGVHVVDEAGRNFGSWMSVERFRKLQQDGNQLATTPVGEVSHMSARIKPTNS